MIKSIVKNNLTGIFLLSVFCFTIFLSHSFASAVTGPTVSPIPGGGTYNAVQSVTLAASAPSTIYYTTDGSTPTTSSPNGPSPVVLVVNSNSTLKYFAKDGGGNSGPIGSATYTILIPTIAPMNDTTATFGISANSAKQIVTQYVTASSTLVGKSIDTITMQLRKGGSPTGTVQVGVFNSDLSVKQLFGNIDPSTLTTSYKQYKVSLTAPQSYQIQSGDRIGIKYTGGNSTNYAAIMTDQSNTFDGTNSYLTYYTSSWQVFTANDLYMILQLHLYGTGPTVSASPTGSTYNSTQSVTLTASGPSTIYYTKDGTAPTFSSTNGPSPLSGISITSNATLKFFAQNSSGKTGPVVTQVYNILLPPTVSASPPGGTYNAAQSVTIAASRVGTIYYTTDGSTPTTSSPNGPSPVSGITVNTNSTLKFFAKDTFGSVSSVVTQVYVISLAPTVSASPPGGTYNSTQSVTLTASAPSTIYYTTDGSTPTTSSPNGPSPVSGITVNTNSTLKFFAKDGGGNTSPINSQVYNILLPPTVSASPPGGTYNAAQSVTIAASRVGTIYYTTDGSTPTTSSPNGPSPVSGITVNSNSTLKFFAKDTFGSVSSVVTQVYTIILPAITASASPPGGTYNSTQSVTLTASAPSTIYYTTDGSTPTTSSPNGPSPVSGITVNTNSTLKFFAKDGGGNTSPINSQVYNILLPPTVSASPPGGTYNAAQSVTIAASRVGTIYYTTDGSTPTTSSPNGPSPVSGITVNSNSTLKFFAKDTFGSVSSVGSASYTILIPTITQMSDNTASYGLNVYAGHYTPFGEYVSASSSLVGKSIDTIKIQLKKVGAPTGNITIGVFDSNQNLKKFFGNQSASALTTGYVQYTYRLPAAQSYDITTGDRIGIKFGGGSSANNVAVMTDQSNTFNGTSSYLSYFFGSAWTNLTGADVTMTLQLRLYGTEPTVSASPLGGTYNATQSVTLTASSPSTIYYTKDGTAPTFSSSNGPSPISGISITSNATLKFFAQGSSGKTGPVFTQAYTIIPPFSVSASPPGGIYNSTQSVTLTASRSSMIYYTTDGSTPTTSSPTGPSPVSGITISTNSTLKFFAKNGAGDTTGVVTQVYTIVPPPTVSASPFGGTYNATQSVTLTASSPSTIYYTKDGTTPTTSSLNGPSPVSISIGTTTTLKFFAKDNFGNIGPLDSRTYTIVQPPTVSASPPGGTYNFTQSVTLTASTGEVGFGPPTIYYTTDGTTPTTSSTNGPSPISGIVVDVNSTLKFFAKDTFGNVSPVVTQVYIIGQPPTVSASPLGGTYESTQSVTLTASIPSTIYYTTNGTTPTTSSPNGPSPLSGISITNNATLKFFAKDNFGNVSPISQASYTILPQTTVSPSPPGGTYNAGQSVTLTASRPSTIYYTTNGTTPTTSSPHNQSPLVLIVNANSTLKYFAKDNYGYSGPIGTTSYTIFLPINTIMNDTTASYGLNVYTGHYQTFGEYASPTSVLVGKSIDSMKLQLKRVGSPTGTVAIGVFDSSQNLKQSFGNFSISSLTTGYAAYTYSLPFGQSYTISSGDRIGLKYTGGDASNNLAIMTDQSNTFDGTNSYLSYFTTSWQGITGVDLTMTMKNHVYFLGPTVSASPPGGTYSSAQSVTLTASKPGTIYYTTDGTTPTLSSTNGPSPISGIVINTDSTLKFFAKDTGGNTGPVFTATYTISYPPLVQMNNNVQAFGLSTYSARPVQAEFISPTSSLVGKYIDTISIKLGRIGSPTGTVQVGVFNNDQSVKQLFSSVDVSTLALSYTPYSFSLPSPQSYQIQSGDRIGIKFTGGDGANYVAIMTDQSYSFGVDADGTNSYLAYYQGGWQPFPFQDYYMTLQLTHFTPPVITITGANPLITAKGAPFTDPGAKAIDTADGNLTSSITKSSNVNANVLGTYTINYTVINSHLFTSKATRTVQVAADATPPVITIRGINPVAVKLNSPYADAGATAIDNVDGNVTGSITTQNTVNTGVVGNYTVTYTVSDSTGNIAHATRNVSVRNDNTAPVITLKGSNPLTVGRDAIYIDPGATVSDPDDSNLSNSIVTVNAVNTGIVGAYNVTYNVNDAVGNAAIQVTRTVNVIDASPVIAMNDTTSTYGLSVYSARPIQAEFVSPTSALVGKSIDTIIVTMETSGSPTGTIQVGVFNDNQTVKKLFGSINAVNVTAHSYSQYAFSLTQFQTYQIQSGDRIGVKFTGGNSTKIVDVMTDQSNTFDGTNSYITYYQGGWQPFTGQDLTMVLEQSLVPTDLPIVTPPVNILSTTTNSSRNIPNLGTALVIDKDDPSPVISNNSTGAFNIGNTTVSWRAIDSHGNIGVANQKISVISAGLPTAQVNRVVMINFDDSYSSIYLLGKPVLDKYNIKTTQYVICGRVEDGDYMSWNMVHAMQADGQDIQAHTMDHLHSNHLSQAQLDYEFGQTPSCFANNGTTGVHMMALPYNEGYNNATVINTIAKYYDMGRGTSYSSFLLHCSGPASTQTDCSTNDSNGNLNQFNRYNIPAWSQDFVAGQSSYNDQQIFSRFIQEVNSATTNISANSTEVPVIIMHRVVQNNGLIPDPQLKGTTTTLLDAEMKYLRDNNFKIWNTKDLAYDTVKNWFFFKAS